MPSVKSCSHPKFDSKCCLWKRNIFRNSVVTIFVYRVTIDTSPELPKPPNRRYRMFFQDIAKYRNRTFGAIFCDILFYKISQKYRRYQRYHRKRVVHQVKFMTLIRRYRRCHIFSKPLSYDIGTFCRFLTKYRNRIAHRIIVLCGSDITTGPQFFLR